MLARPAASSAERPCHRSTTSRRCVQGLYDRRLNVLDGHFPVRWVNAQRLARPWYRRPMTAKRVLGIAAFAAFVACVVGFTAGALAKGPPLGWVKDYVLPFWAPFVSLCGAFGFAWWFAEKGCERKGGAGALSGAEKVGARAMASIQLRRDATRTVASWRYLNTDGQDVQDRWKGLDVGSRSEKPNRS